MTLLIDECVNGRVIVPALVILSSCEFVADHCPGADDREVLALANAMGRILVTEDYGFGRLIYAEHLPAPPGVVLFALGGRSEEDRAGRAHLVAREAIALANGSFVVVEMERVRVRALP